MGQPADCAVQPLPGGGYRLFCADQPDGGVIALVLEVRDRRGDGVGWRLQPKVFMQGPARRDLGEPRQGARLDHILQR